eukprot:scaffold1839_cov382-Prasinococcus_capsulatus_cf.AAC.29
MLRPPPGTYNEATVAHLLPAERSPKVAEQHHNRSLLFSPQTSQRDLGAIRGKHCHAFKRLKGCWRGCC